MRHCPSLSLSARVRLSCDCLCVCVCVCVCVCAWLVAMAEQLAQPIEMDDITPRVCRGPSCGTGTAMGHASSLGDRPVSLRGEYVINSSAMRAVHTIPRMCMATNSMCASCHRQLSPPQLPTPHHDVGVQRGRGYTHTTRLRNTSGVRSKMIDE